MFEWLTRYRPCKAAEAILEENARLSADLSRMLNDAREEATTVLGAHRTESPTVVPRPQRAAGALRAREQ